MSKQKSHNDVMAKQGIKVSVHNSPPRSVPLALPTSPDMIPAFEINDSITAGSEKSPKRTYHTLVPELRNQESDLVKRKFQNSLTSNLMDVGKVYIEEEKVRSECTKEQRTDQDIEEEKVRSECTKDQRTDQDELCQKVLTKEKQIWTRTAPAELFYTLSDSYSSKSKIKYGTNNLLTLCNEFEENLLKNINRVRSSDSVREENRTKEELGNKKNDLMRPRLHKELWFNERGEMNDGPVCGCSVNAQHSGIRHNIYHGESKIPPCDPNSNNADKLHHYRIIISPTTNFTVSMPTVIKHDAHEYIFEGFSIFSHKKLEELPLCKIFRFNIEYTIMYYEESFPENFTVQELNLFYKYLFREILELVDLDFHSTGDPEGCPQYHFMPRFTRQLPGCGKEILSMNEILSYLLQSAKPLIPKKDLVKFLSMPQTSWQCFTENIKGTIVTYPEMKPCSLRVDHLDRHHTNYSEHKFPDVIHIGVKPQQLSYEDCEYKKTLKDCSELRYLLANMAKPSFEDKRKLEAKEMELQHKRSKIELKRKVTVSVNSENAQKTGIRSDVVQHALTIPVLVSHFRFHGSLDFLEEKINYKFTNRFLLQLALTHPSYNENLGTNPDHIRNVLTNCGIRHPIYGDRQNHKQSTKNLIDIMSRYDKGIETECHLTHNERLEFLGNAVVEFVSSVHVFSLFSAVEEGGLSTYRDAIVNNQHLAVLAKSLDLEEFILCAHGSNFCNDCELTHATANCFEALIGALFLDGGINVAEKVFGETQFHYSEKLQNEWINYPPHPLQEAEPLGDRKWIPQCQWLETLTKFEESFDVKFNHIRLLAQALTHKSISYNNVTLGCNQRLQFLGSAVLKLVVSEYLYKQFPEHREGNLSLLQSTLVSSETLALVCNDLGMTQYALYSKSELTTKDKAGLVVAFLGALYIDQGIEYCRVFCNPCFFRRLPNLIAHQSWIDSKSKLHQYCLTLQTTGSGPPEIPVYKVIRCVGPTNDCIYTVSVNYKDRRLAKASNRNIEQAEKNAAKKAFKNAQGIPNLKTFFPVDQRRRQSQSDSRSQTKNKNVSNKRTTSPPIRVRRLLSRSKSPLRKLNQPGRSDSTHSRKDSSSEKIQNKSMDSMSSKNAAKKAFKNAQGIPNLKTFFPEDQRRRQSQSDSRSQTKNNNFCNKRTTSPPIRVRRLLSRSKSPLRKINRPGRSESTHSRKDSSSEKIQNKSMDSMSGRQYFPSIQQNLKSYTSKSLLTDRVFDKSAPHELSQPAISSHSYQNLTHYNQHPINHINAALTQFYNQNYTGWNSIQYSFPQCSATMQSFGPQICDTTQNFNYNTHNYTGWNSIQYFVPQSSTTTQSYNPQSSTTTQSYSHQSSTTTQSYSPQSSETTQSFGTQICDTSQNFNYNSHNYTGWNSIQYFVPQSSTTTQSYNPQSSTTTQSYNPQSSTTTQSYNPQSSKTTQSYNLQSSTTAQSYNPQSSTTTQSYNHQSSETTQSYSPQSSETTQSYSSQSSITTQSSGPQSSETTQSYNTHNSYSMPNHNFVLHLE